LLQRLDVVLSLMLERGAEVTLSDNVMRLNDLGIRTPDIARWIVNFHKGR
jgi:hypothetical protein